MLKPPLLAIPPRGALNMHGSLLPRYRGRVPVNWAVLHGERETGATLHYMAEKPDAGDIVAQTGVPILPDDTAADVFAKVTVAAEIALDGALPALLAGTAPRMPMDLRAGSLFRGAARPPTGASIGRRMPGGSTISSVPWRRLTRVRRPRWQGDPARILRTRVLDPAAAPCAPSLRLEKGCAGGALRRRRNPPHSRPGDRRSGDRTLGVCSTVRHRAGRPRIAAAMDNDEDDSPKSTVTQGLEKGRLESADRRHHGRGDDDPGARPQARKQRGDHDRRRAAPPPRGNPPHLPRVPDQLRRAGHVLDRASRPVPLREAHRPRDAMDQPAVHAAW